MTHGEIIFSIAKALTEFKPYAVYLEMGVYTGETFNLVAPLFKEAWAVDADARMYDFIKNNANLKWYLQYTDDFILNLDSRAQFDMVFIDANHQHEQSLRDFTGIVPYVKENGLIILHDTYPPNKEFLSPSLCGDTYKTAWYIRQHFRDDFEIVTIPYCYGVSIVRKIKKQVLWLE
jgi:hypothetical protein